MGELVGEGREAETLAWGDGKVLRLLRYASRTADLDRLVAAMTAANDAGAPVPAVYERVHVDGRPGVVMERVDGPDLLTVVERGPWRFRWAARVLGRVHAVIHDTVAPQDLPDLRSFSEERIRSTDVPTDLADFARRRLDELPDGDRLCHGDFHPGNVLVGERGPVAIDWTNGTRGDPNADIARTMVMFRLGELPPDSSALLRRFDRIGRRAFVRLYGRAYRRARSVDDMLVERWTPVRAVERLFEDIEGERPRLLALIEQAYERSR